jgi:hypothetical protein
VEIHRQQVILQPLLSLLEFPLHLTGPCRSNHVIRHSRASYESALRYTEPGINAARTALVEGKVLAPEFGCLVLQPDETRQFKIVSDVEARMSIHAATPEELSAN